MNYYYHFICVIDYSFPLILCNRLRFHMWMVSLNYDALI